VGERYRRRAGAGPEGNDVIRYVDSSGWTWAVCELADRPSADGLADAAPVERPALLAERRLTLSPPRADAAPDWPDDVAGDTADDTADDPDADDAMDAPGELYFFSRLGTRKLRGYPARWAALPRAELEALCARARDVGMDGAEAVA
jgi:hypothetical protein